MSRVDSADSIAGVINIHRRGQNAGIRESITVDAVRWPLERILEAPDHASSTRRGAELSRPLDVSSQSGSLVAANRWR